MTMAEPQFETQSQIIKSVLDIVEAFGLPDTAVDKIRKKCWQIANYKDNDNGVDKNISNIN